MDPQNKELYKIILIGSGILLSVLAYFIISIIRQQRRVYKWQQARIAAEITTLENERRRIAGDLHDELGPILSAVRLQVNHLEPTDETEKIVLDKSSQQIDEVIKRFREISYNLLPNTLVRKGLIRAVEEYIDKMQTENGVQISFTGNMERPEANKEVNIYRIIQEIVHNTIKHARATKLAIAVSDKTGKILLTTKDDGIGFNYQEMESKGGGLGLLNLQSRVEVLNGSLYVNTLPGKGTEFSIEIPL
jgi:two-component system, NarL family, sensor kinase